MISVPSLTIEKRGTLIERMMMINYDFILTNHKHHNDQRSLSNHRKKEGTLIERASFDIF
jgi:hypothetical protein